jgi:predicted outer membrane protein
MTILNVRRAAARSARLASAAGIVLIASAVTSAQDPVPTPPPAETKAVVLVVTVVGLAQTAESPVTEATVTIFAGDHREGQPTDDSGKVTFRFSTEVKTVTLRVVADKWQTHQQQLELDAAEKTQKVLLKPSPAN